MENESNHIVNFLILVNEPIDLFDLFMRSDDKAFKDKFKFEAPTNNLNQSISLSAQLNQNFIIKKLIAEYDVAVFNINFSKKVRGAFKISKTINNVDISSDEQIFAKLKDLVANLKYTDIFAYEISISGLINHNNYGNFEKAEKLQSMSSPKYRSIKIIDGVKDNKDLRQQYISEIDLEQNVADPSKSNLLGVYRTHDFQIGSLDKLLRDIRTVIGTIE